MSGPLQSQSPDQSWSARGAVVVGLLGLCILVGGFGSWAVLSNIAGAVVASGKFEVDRNRQVVQHIDGGVVAEILMDEGDTVVAGQTLIKLDSSELSSQLVITEGQLFELMARRGRLEAERDTLDIIEFAPELLELGPKRPEVADLLAGQERLFAARKASQEREIEQLQKRALQIQEQIVGIKAQQDSMRTQLELIDQELVGQQSLLDRGLAQASTVLTLRRTKADLQGSLGELIASEAQSNERITELDIETLKLGTSQREEAITQLRDLRYQELELSETRRSLRERLERLDIRAPVSGIVYGLSVQTPRSVIRPADPVLYLVPQDRPLVIAAQVEITDINHLYIGQDVAVRLPALDQVTTPELVGAVSLVSADAFQDEQSGAAFYRVEITLNAGEQDRLPQDVILLPGMPVESFIRTADRSPLSYLVQPLTDYFVRAFRES